MANYSEIVGAAVGEFLDGQNYAGDIREMAEAVLPIAARGNNLVVVTPPSTRYAVPVLAGVYHHLKAGTGARALVLVPEGTISSWTHTADAPTDDLQVHVGEGQSRAARLLSTGNVDVLVTTLPTAIALQQRATLKVDALLSIVLVWPELWADDTALTALMTDAKEAQRVILTSDPTAVAGLVERYARKAITLGVPAQDQTAPGPIGPVRTVVVAERDRAHAMRGLVETLDPATLAVWAVDTDSLGDAVLETGTAGALPEHATGDVPSAKTVVAWDLPTRARLTQLLGAGEVVLLVPPHAERWAAQNLRDRRPLRVHGPVDVARDEAAKRRAQVTDTLEAGVPTTGLLALAPLFERHDASLIAAALYQLWSNQAMTAPASTHAPSMAGGTPAATGIMWVSAGSADNLQPKDIVGALVNEIKVDRASIGKVDVKEKFTLVELPAADVQRISEAFTGTTLKRKRVLARPDRAREGAPVRPDRDRPSRGPRTERPPRRRE